MRALMTLIAAVIIAALAIFVVQNGAAQPMQFLGMGFTTSIGWAVGGAAILGFVLGLLFLAPGRVASGWRGRSLRRERDRIQQEAAAIQADRVRLEAEHERLRNEHRQVVSERDRLRATTTPATTPARPMAAASAPAAQPGVPVPDAQQAPRPIEASNVSDNQGNGVTTSIDDSATHPPTLGERIRGAIYPPRDAAATPERDDVPQGPGVPTT